MTPIFRALFAFLGAGLRSRAAMQIEILALRHQLAVCQRSVKRPRLRPADRVLSENSIDGADFKLPAGGST